MSQHLILISDAEQTCGVEEFARQTARHLGTRGNAAVLGSGIGTADDLVLNLPVVAWKKKLLSPILAALEARLKRREVTLILHEWADLALARRISYLPLLPLATRVLFSAPEVMASFAATPVSRVVTRRRGVVPIPPNFSVPEWTRRTRLAESLAADRAAGKLVLAQFGSIYPRKEPQALLETAAELVRRGIDLRVVFFGSFIGDAVEATFRSEVERLGLGDKVEVTGYIASPAELYGLFEEVDVFLYPLSEGLTSRRASVLAAALSGRPVVVTAPRRTDSLQHHRLFKSLLSAGSIQLVPAGAAAPALADAVLGARSTKPAMAVESRQVTALWGDLVAALDA